MSNASVATANVTAQNTGTDWIVVRGSKLVDISVGQVGDSTTSTVHLQRSFDHAQATIRDVESYSVDTEQVSRNATTCYMRLFVKTSNYVDNARLRIAAGNKE